MARDRRLRTSRPIRVRGSVIASHSGSCARWRGRQRTTVTGCKTPPTLLRSVGRTRPAPPPDRLTVAAAGGLLEEQRPHVAFTAPPYNVSLGDQRDQHQRRMQNDAMPPADCLLYTSDAADDLLCVDLGGRRIIK